MQKTFNLIIVLFVWVGSIAQEKTKHEYQQQQYNRAIDHLKAGDTVGATIASKLVIPWVIDSQLAISAKTMYDHLLPFTEKIIKQKLIGKWTLYKVGSNWGYSNVGEENIDKVLIIDSTHFSFYDLDKDTGNKTLTNKEEIQFTRHENMFGLKLEFVFFDNKIWSFQVDEQQDVLKQTNTGIESFETRSEIICGNLEFHYRRK